MICAMEDASKVSDPITNTTPRSSSSPSPPKPKPTPLPSDQDNHNPQQEDFAANFASLYHSVFPPKSTHPCSFSFSPSPSSSASSSTSTELTTENRLYQASLILEYKELSDHYELCLARLTDITTELESLRQENFDLRMDNLELLKLLKISSNTTGRSRIQGKDNSDFGPPSGIEPSRIERRTTERAPLMPKNSLPKSISVRSSGYLKTNLKQGQGNNGLSLNPSRQLVANELETRPVQQRVYVPTVGEKGKEEALEFDVYNQGMLKTELCNKWQEIGTCPYGDQCQFAHGINELRPVIRHPRYKTEVCRMVLAGDMCPYGHRCHFRHSLTEQERLMIQQ